MVSKSTLRNSTWELIQDTLKNDSTLSSLVNGVYSAYPRDFVENLGGLPFIVINKPEISDTRLTLPTNGIRIYSVEVEIHIIVGGQSRSASLLKKITDTVEYVLESNQSTFQDNGLENYTLTNEGTDFEFRKGEKIHYGILRVSFDYSE